MPKPIASPIEVSACEKKILEQTLRRASAPQWLVTRSKIILQASAGNTNQQIAHDLKLTRNTVRYWRKRWQAQVEQRLACTESELAEQITRQLQDAYRSGTPGKFSAKQIAAIIALACEVPQSSGYGVSHWTAKELALEAVKRGIVSDISERQVGRFLKRGRFTSAP